MVKLVHSAEYGSVMLTALSKYRLQRVTGKSAPGTQYHDPRNSSARVFTEWNHFTIVDFPHPAAVVLVDGAARVVDQ